MKAGSGDHFEQAYNAQAAVETVESKAEASTTERKRHRMKTQIGFPHPDSESG